MHMHTLSTVALGAAAVLLVSVCPAVAGTTKYLDLARHGRLVCWSAPEDGQGAEVLSLNEVPPGTRAIGIVWDEERDVREIRVRFAGGAVPDGTAVQYWFQHWPLPPPNMPTIEDRLDDIWQGKWLTAAAQTTTRDGTTSWTFKPLNRKENDEADNLPGVQYRRTLKARLLLPEKSPKIESLEVYSDSMIKPLSVRIEFGCGQTQPAAWSGHLEIFNGTIVSARPWDFADADVFTPPCSWQNVRTGKPKGIVADLLVSVPAPPGSNDMTVVTVRNEADVEGQKLPRTFSFNTLDLENGPIFVPDLNAYVTLADDPKYFSPNTYAAGRTIRDRIPAEPEQTYERAGREIPPLDPWCRQNGGRVYLPVAADSSWQKFAVEYGGDILLDKHETKAKGAELKRLRWEGDQLRFQIGTGAKPYYRADQKAKVSVAEECLPIIINRWEDECIEYEEEVFATLLSGPLDPNDPERSEQTPAVLMLRLRAHNPGASTLRADIRLNIKPAEELEIAGRRIMAKATRQGPCDAPRLRAVLRLPDQAKAKTASGSGLMGMNSSVITAFDVPAGGTESLFVSIPFVSDVAGPDADSLESLNYDLQRKRVADYWRNMIARTTRFSTPEPEFNHFARFVVPHIHISTTKDPKSGLYMVPAASYGYMVFANESCFQILMLDALGDTERATHYLKTLTDLQGSKPFPGNYTPPHDGVYHGAKVDDEYDYTHHNYGLDQGTVLWTLACHYFYTRDRAWLEKTLPSMTRAVEWIERQRAATKKQDVRGEKVLEYGLLPAGHLEDNDDWGYWFSVNAYCVAGMVEMARAMKDIGHADAERMQHQASAYRADLRTAILRATELAPVTRMRDGTYSPYVPTRLYQRFRYFGPLRVQLYSRYNKPAVLPCYRLSATREVLYGPMILLNLEVFRPDEPMADWILDDWEDNLTLSSSGGFNVHGFTDDNLWFSQGGMVFQSNLQNPVLVYLKRNEAPAAIRGLYNNFVACLYPEVNTFTEEYREWRRASGPFYKSPDEARFVNRLRDALVLESGDDLWLASGAPRRWPASKEGIRVDRINSCFGPVGYHLHAGDQPNTIVAKVQPPTKAKPKNLWLYIRCPDNKRITAVEINGKPWTDFDPARERIRLPHQDQPLNVVVRY